MVHVGREGYKDRYNTVREAVTHIRIVERKEGQTDRGTETKRVTKIFRERLTANTFD